MNPSSAIALVSATLGAATPLGTSFVSVWATESPQPAIRPAAAAMIAAHFTHPETDVFSAALLLVVIKFSVFVPSQPSTVMQHRANYAARACGTEQSGGCRRDAGTR